MFDFKPIPPSPTARRREAARLLRPALTSSRLVRLFLNIALLAATRPQAVRTIEMAVDRLSNTRPARAGLADDAHERATYRAFK